MITQKVNTRSSAATARHNKQTGVRAQRNAERGDAAYNPHRKRCCTQEKNKKKWPTPHHRPASNASATAPPRARAAKVVAPAAPAKRVKDAAVCCPLVYGSLAFWLGRKADEFHTHKWTLFVRGPHGEDLGYFVEKVVFKLHPSFAQPVREVTKPPFEVSEKGWGEFECHIRIHFKDPTEKPVEVSHIVKLYDGTTPQAANQPVVSEVYDEVVFHGPARAVRIPQGTRSTSN